MSAQVTIAKPVTQSAAKASKVVAQKVAAPEGVRFALQAGTARPQAGRALFAHTVGFMQASGMLIGGSVPRKLAREVLGDTAVAYHTKKGNLTAGEQVALTDDGTNFFAIRPADVDAVNAYSDFFTTGKVSSAMQKVGSDSFIRKVA